MCPAGENPGRGRLELLRLAGPIAPFRFLPAFWNWINGSLCRPESAHPFLPIRVSYILVCRPGYQYLYEQLSSSALQVRSTISHLLANQKPQAAGAAEFGGLRCRSLCSPLSTICGFQSKKPRQLQLTRRSTDHDPFSAVPQLTLDVLLVCIQPGFHPVSSIVGQLFAPPRSTQSYRTCTSTSGTGHNALSPLCSHPAASGAPR